MTWRNVQFFRGPAATAQPEADWLTCIINIILCVLYTMLHVLRHQRQSSRWQHCHFLLSRCGAIQSSSVWACSSILCSTCAVRCLQMSGPVAGARRCQSLALHQINSKIEMTLSDNISGGSEWVNKWMTERPCQLAPMNVNFVRDDLINLLSTTDVVSLNHPCRRICFYLTILSTQYIHTRYPCHTYIIWIIQTWKF